MLVDCSTRRGNKSKRLLDTDCSDKQANVDICVLFEYASSFKSTTVALSSKGPNYRSLSR